MSDKIFFILFLICAILSFIIFSSIEVDDPDEIPSDSVEPEVIDKDYIGHTDMVVDEEDDVDVLEEGSDNHIPVPSGGGSSASSESGGAAASPILETDNSDTESDVEEGSISLVITNLIKSYTSRKVSKNSDNTLVIRIIS